MAGVNGARQSIVFARHDGTKIEVCGKNADGDLQVFEIGWETGLYIAQRLLDISLTAKRAEELRESGRG